AAQAAGVGLDTLPNTVTTLAGSAGTSSFFFANTGSLTVGTVDGVSGITTVNPGWFLFVTVNGANNVLTVNQPLTSGGSLVALTADDMATNAAVNGGAAVVLLTPFTVARTVDLGTNSGGNLGLIDAELDRVTASVLQIGSFSPQFTGNVTNTSAITQMGSGYTTLLINTTGSVTNGGGSIPGNNLAILPGTRIGPPGTPLGTLVSNLAFQNSTSSVVNVGNIGGLTIANVPGVNTSFNSGTTTTLVASGPITFAVNTSSVGDLTVSAGESGSPGDNLTVNTGVTASTSAGNIVLQAGDNLVVQSGATVSASGSLTLTAGFTDVDGIGALTINGTITAGAGTTLNLTAVQDITLGGPGLNFPTSTVNITSTQGAIVDGNDPPTGTNNITATTLNLSARRGIGSGPGANKPFETT